MECLDMSSSSSSSSTTTSNQNSDHKSLSCAAVSPRISFSNDFAESNRPNQQMIKPRESPASSDFEFSVANYSMMSADELFFKGRFLPFKDSCAGQLQKPTTLREELLVDDEDDNDFSLRPPKGSARWKEILGLKKTHIGSKKPAKADGSSVEKRPGLVYDQEAHATSKSSQELLNNGGSNCRDVDFGL